MANSIADSSELTRRLRQTHPPRDGWELEVSVETDPATVAVHLREGQYRHAILVTYLRGGPQGSNVWSQMYDTAVALYGMLLENKLNSRDLPQGDEVGFNGATYRVVIEYTWAG